ncbi:MAG: transglutaminase domain-containing protein [Methanobacterium sp.]
MAITDKTILRLGSKEKVNIKALQMRLQTLKFYKGKIDGDYGNMTKTAVMNYQKSKGLVRDGVAGPITLRKLGLLFSTPTPNKVKTPVSTIPDDIKPYLTPTKNCQSTDPKIIALAQKITTGLTNPLDKTKAIFKYVRDIYDYAFYYNTRYGAVGMLNQKAGNCTDDSHLINALNRAVGIPARYHHVKAQFKSGVYGHTVPEAWINGKWYREDATNNANEFDRVSWNLVQDLGYFKELPY